MLYEQQEPDAVAEPAATPAPATTTDTSTATPVEGMTSAEEGMTGETQGMSTDSGGGFGGLQGLGGSGGGGGEGGDTGTGGDTDSEPAGESEQAPADTKPESNPEDPIGTVIETAEELANSTDNVANITKAIKASIQVNFSNYADAWPIVQQLKNSENETLRAVSRRLALFIAGA